MGGTYTLVLSVPDDTTVRVGALGRVSFPAGGYAYVGSARASGGFARVARHRRLAAGDHEARHWHVDSLLADQGVTFDGVVAAPGADCECAVARSLGAGPVQGFGASDCDCDSHLARRESVEAIRRAVVDGFWVATGNAVPPFRRQEIGDDDPAYR